MSPRRREGYHSGRSACFAETAADMVTAITMTYAEEATGIVACGDGGRVPAAISFTVETDGRLPSGQPLGEAIEQTDAETGGAPAYFMVNCAHPTHFLSVLEGRAAGSRDPRGIRANASTHEPRRARRGRGARRRATPPTSAPATVALGERLPHLAVLGGCCGTDHRHVARSPTPGSPRPSA